MKTRRLRKGGAKMKPMTKKQNKSKKMLVSQMKAANTVANIKENLEKKQSKLREYYSKKKDIDADPAVFLVRMNNFLKSLKEYNESASEFKLQQADQIAAVIMAETADTLKDLGTPINIDPENIEDRFEYIEELQEIVEDLLKENEKYARLKLDMAALALSIHEAIREARESFKPVVATKKNANLQKAMAEMARNENKNNLGNLLNLFGKVGL